MQEANGSPNVGDLATATDLDFHPDRERDPALSNDLDFHPDDLNFHPDRERDPVLSNDGLN